MNPNTKITNTAAKYVDVSLRCYEYNQGMDLARAIFCYGLKIWCSRNYLRFEGKTKGLASMVRERPESIYLMEYRETINYKVLPPI